MTTATATRDDLKVGGKYTAVDNGDGTYNILDVCVFAEIPAGVKRNQKPIGREWQEAALLKSKARAAGGHLPPVHVYHSDEMAVKPIYAGKFRLTSVKQGMYEGKKLWMSFADILGIPADIFEKIRRGFLSYRSIEVHNWANPEIDSMALMDTDVPFFRMPMLTIGSVLHKDAELFMDRTRPSVACRLGKKQGGVILFRFAERGTMADKDKDKDEDDALNAPPKSDDAGEKPTPDDRNKVDDPFKKEPNTGTVEDEPNARKGPGGAEMEEDGKGEVTKDDLVQHEKDEMLNPEPPAPAVDMGPVMSMMQSIGTMMKQILDRLGPQAEPQEKLEAVNGMNIPAEATGQDFKATDEKEIDMAGEKGKEEQKILMSANELKAFVGGTVSEAVLKAVTPLMAEVNTLKADREKEAKQGAVASRFNAAKKELADNGQTVSGDAEKHLLKCAEIGEDFLKDQVAVFKSTLPKEPPKSGDEFETGLARQASQAASDDEVNAFCAEKGPQHAGWAKKEMAKYRAFQATGSCDMTAEEWLTVNFRASSMFERNRV